MFFCFVLFCPLQNTPWHCAVSSCCPGSLHYRFLASCSPFPLPAETSRRLSATIQQPAPPPPLHHHHHHPNPNQAFIAVKPLPQSMKCSLETRLCFPLRTVAKCKGRADWRVQRIRYRIHAMGRRADSRRNGEKQ